MARWSVDDAIVAGIPINTIEIVKSFLQEEELVELCARDFLLHELHGLSPGLGSRDSL